MKASLHRQLARRNRQIQNDSNKQPGVERSEPMMTATYIHYEIADKVREIDFGGINVSTPGLACSPFWLDQEMGSRPEDG